MGKLTKPILSKEYDVIQYQGKTYNIPLSVGIRNDLGSHPEILKKRMEISSKLGMEFRSHDGAFSCIDCAHTGIFTEKIKCKYDPDDSVPQWLSYFSRKDGKETIGFAARMNPCIVDVGLLEALAESGKLDEYLIDSSGTWKASDFPYIRDINPNTDSERRAIKMTNDFFG